MPPTISEKAQNIDNRENAQNLQNSASRSCRERASHFPFAATVCLYQLIACPLHYRRIGKTAIGDKCSLVATHTCSRAKHIDYLMASYNVKIDRLI